MRIYILKVDSPNTGMTRFLAFVKKSDRDFVWNTLRLDSLRTPKEGDHIKPDVIIECDDMDSWFTIKGEPQTVAAALKVAKRTLAAVKAKEEALVRMKISIGEP